MTLEEIIMSSPESLIAIKTTWSFDLKPTAVLLLADEERTQTFWRENMASLSPESQVVVFPRDDWDFRLVVDRLQSLEGVPLFLEVQVQVHLVDPHKFWLDVMHREERLTAEEFQAYLSDLVRRAIGPYVASKYLADLDTEGVGSTIAERVRRYVEEENIRHRSGFALDAVHVEGLRFRLQEGERGQARNVYLGHSLPSSRRASVAVAQTPILRSVRDAASRSVGPKSVWRMPSSAYRPERWRYSLGQQVKTKPLVHENRVYVATEAGVVWAFARERDPELGADRWPLVWPEPARLPTRPGLGMVVAAETLWVSGENGVLYGLRLSDGRVIHQVTLGGRLRSAPTAVDKSLYVATDRPKGTLSPGQGGRLVRIDPHSGGIVKDIVLTPRGLRGQPIAWGEFLFLTDRRNTVYRVDLQLEAVERWSLRGVGRLLAGGTVDRERGQIVVVDGAPGYGTVVTLDVHGRERQRTRLPGTIIAPPLVWKDTLFVPVSGNHQRGYLYRLDPHTLAPLGEPLVTDGPVTSSPVAFEDVIIFGSHDGLVYAVWAANGKVFWKYHSGERVLVSPAVTEDGLVYVVDEAGNLSALPWYGANVVEGARWAKERGRVEDAVRLWEEAGDVEMAMGAAEEHKRWDMAADIAFGYGYYERAAWYAEQVAETLQRRKRMQEAVRWWRYAAEAWEKVEEGERRFLCLKKVARLAGWPLLHIDLLNRPRIQRGGLAQLQLEVKNVGNGPARDVEIEIRGMVDQVQRKVLEGVIEPGKRRLPVFHVYPSEVGMARLVACARYRLPNSHRVVEEYREIVLSVDREPEVHYHYHGAFVRIGGDGVVILRDKEGQIQADIGGDGVVIGGKGEKRTRLYRAEKDDGIMAGDAAHNERYCPHCGERVEPGYKFCPRCGLPLQT